MFAMTGINSIQPTTQMAWEKVSNAQTASAAAEIGTRPGWFAALGQYVSVWIHLGILEEVLTLLLAFVLLFSYLCVCVFFPPFLGLQISSDL